MYVCMHVYKYLMFWSTREYIQRFGVPFSEQWKRHSKFSWKTIFGWKIDENLDTGAVLILALKLKDFSHPQQRKLGILYDEDIREVYTPMELQGKVM